METPTDIERKAIDGSGVLGSVYDVRRDCILKRDFLSFRRQSSELSKSHDCKIEKGSLNATLNLLQFIGIQHELRLNLLLHLTTRVGIASVMNYSRQINECTRFLYYSRITRKEQLTSTAEEAQNLNRSSGPPFDATHIITSIDIGIDIIAVLQLPSEADITMKIDDILQKIRRILLNDDDNILVLTSDEKILLRKIINVTIYSNTSSFTSLTDVSDILHEIDRIRKKNFDHCHPVTYYLRPTKRLFPRYKGAIAPFNDLPSALVGDIEQYMLRFRTPINYVEASMKSYMPKLLFGRFQDILYSGRKQWSALKDKYTKETKRLSELVISIRAGRYNVSTIDWELSDNELSTLLNSIDELTQNTDNSEEKGQFITQSCQQQFECSNIIKRQLNENDTVMITEYMVRKDDRYDEILSTNTASGNNNNHSASTHFDQLLIDEDRKSPSLPLISGAESYPSFQLQNTIISSSSIIDDDRNQSKQRTPSPIDLPQISVLPTLSSSTTDQIINILLLGETGVGKSTFINAFVNYLSFDTLQQAQLNKPVVLIPVSFLMTIGDNFEERIVKFGDIDNSKNEDFDHPGQSVTRHCKSYIFYLNHTNGKKLRIIDTPGFGDTRGLDQDDHNMQHILQYINTMTHLNAICILLKPNASRLNIFFRSCLTQLFSLLNPKICDNIIFCFTNARSTFYTPGDTAPLLKRMLTSLPIADIPFKKENTFCFDSESFRYLVALQNGISFNDEDKREYDMSWSTSVKESNRLISYTHTKLIVYRMQDGWESIKHAQFELAHMIRPILEAMRNILRNIILGNMEPRNKSIELCPIVIHRSAYLCLSCNQKAIIQIGDFWIMEDRPHEFQNTCSNCSCASDQHIPIDYILSYKSINNSTNYYQDSVNDMLAQLCHDSAQFAYFLIYVAHYTKDDPFLLGLIRMIVQENDLCDHQKPNHLNLQLTKELMELQRRYEQIMNGIKSNQKQIALSAIYKLINTIREYPMIREQMAAVKQGQEIMLKQYEYEYQEI